MRIPAYAAQRGRDLRCAARGRTQILRPLLEGRTSEKILSPKQILTWLEEAVAFAWEAKKQWLKRL